MEQVPLNFAWEKSSLQKETIKVTEAFTPEFIPFFNKNELIFCT